MPELLWSVGDVVRKLREGKRRQNGKPWRQEDLAAGSTLHKTTIINLEAGRDSDPRTIYLAAKALGVSVADLYAYAEPVSLTAQQREWVKLLTDLDDSRREIVLALARAEQEAQTDRAIAARSAPTGDALKTGTGDGS